MTARGAWLTCYRNADAARENGRANPSQISRAPAAAVGLPNYEEVGLRCVRDRSQ